MSSSSDSRLLTRIALRNYKSIAACDVRPSQLSFLVGPNGAGSGKIPGRLPLARHGRRALRRNLVSLPSRVRGHATVIQPHEGDSFWQPVPANGHADPKLTPANTRYDELSIGNQTIAPGSRVREHAHGDQIEVQICFRGWGRVVVDGVSHPLVPGTACFLGADVKHEIINETDEELVMLWLTSPAGLENFFKAIGAAAHTGRAGACAVRAAGRRRRDRACVGDDVQA